MKPYLSNIVAIIFNRRLAVVEYISFARFATEICIIYGRSTTSIRTVRGWFRKFGIDNFNMEDEERSGRSSNTNTELIKAMIDKNPRYTVRELVDILNILRITIHIFILQKIGYFNHSKRNEKDPFLKRLITGDETWILYENITRKQSWFRDKKPLTKVAMIWFSSKESFDVHFVGLESHLL
ncbi:hypothetical protein HZH68_012641 [Vespula germanica]|uniref:Mos1 transposase HTH domain-containing protein n=1 Tax=Vespula germanica TaxID=30212 RepID=A0A834MYR5_VESGE|nr:hypothetical protein HZH68_012641 [Vespula germanica]